MTSLRLATRGSPLALAQAERVATMLRAFDSRLEIAVVTIRTSGDAKPDVSLRDIGGQGVFTREIQRAVLSGEADLAVHSAKDLESQAPEGLVLASVPERLDPADVLVGRSLAGLGPGATVATGSARRRALLGDLRPDLRFVDLRGNMARRLALAGTGGVDAVVTAVCALARLGRSELVAERLDPGTFIPQVGQGAIALEARVDDVAAEVASRISAGDALACVRAERSFLATLGAGCTKPVGAWCVRDGQEFVIRAVLDAGDDVGVRRATRRGVDPEALGRAVADELVS